MKTIHRFLKAIQSTTKFDSKNIKIAAAKKRQFSKNSDSLLFLINNNKENEFLFI
ncbi:hypothetical protein SAMN05443549_10164 [Flavobacterium fluvii]|uniref:Uncharacterized protein n=1 Tax=Flavobacterium fluvii TaxID=468056 RepID=A0A1M5DTM6_9FLAO|nr:hypothetical protein [Flavobacterium fluvii]SHF70152.1 hypothetical protein SAMN05443549_10164 [Flavobacterium fluvii]